eukprot:GAHX01001089.1.p1 GENE.GAHX01001089.1~~GAHX01001089.1.p1  ORF type:complete len:230 (+),score=53.34 GAHX01001089.1:222-911(+)
MRRIIVFYISLILLESKRDNKTNSSNNTVISQLSFSDYNNKLEENILRIENHVNTYTKGMNDYRKSLENVRDLNNTDDSYTDLLRLLLEQKKKSKRTIVKNGLSALFKKIGNKIKGQPKDVESDNTEDANEVDLNSYLDNQKQISLLNFISENNTNKLFTDFEKVKSPVDKITERFEQVKKENDNIEDKLKQFGKRLEKIQKDIKEKLIKKLNEEYKDFMEVQTKRTDV